MAAEDIDIALDDFEVQLEQLRALYERYFQGTEEIEPSIARQDVDRRFSVLRRAHIPGSAPRLRLQLLAQRYDSLQQYWARTCREIENGTYHREHVQEMFAAEQGTRAAGNRSGGDRDVPDPHTGSERTPISGEIFREMLQSGMHLSGEAKRAGEEAKAAENRPAIGPIGSKAPAALKLAELGRLELDFDEEPAPLKSALPRPATAASPPMPQPALIKEADLAAAPTRLERLPPQPATRPLPVTAAPLGSGIPDARIRELHAELVAARRTLQQGDGVSVDSLARTLRDAEQKLRAQHPDRVIDFQVIVRGGKPVVKPILRK